MKGEDIAPGMYVTINHDISKTSRKYSANRTMKSMRGKTYKLKSGLYSRRSITIKGFRWHIDDISEANIEKPSLDFHFNAEELCL